MAFLVLASLLFIPLVLCYKWIRSYIHFYKTTQKIPSPKINVFLIFGVVLIYVYKKIVPMPFVAFIDQIGAALCAVFRKEKICVFWVAMRPLILLFKPETVEPILNSNTTIDKSVEYKFLHPWLGFGLLTSTGERWKSRRRLLTPSFHFRILETFIPSYNEHSQVLVQRLKSSVNEKYVDIVPIVTRCALDIICETIMGVKIDTRKNSVSEYVTAVHQINETMFIRLLRPWQWVNWIFYWTPNGKKYLKNIEKVHRLTRKVIKEKKYLLTLKEGKADAERDMLKEDSIYEGISHSKRKAFLELLLDHHIEDPTFTEEDIREEVDTFMFEGHDTTAMAASWALYNIGLRPDIQENIFKELDDIFGDDKTRPVTSDDLKSMKYLERVLKESLRLYPSVPFIARDVKHEVNVLNYTICPGSTCVICVKYMHMDPDTYPNPEIFDPDRFLPENSVGRHPFAYIPFSAGPRNCIGQKFALMEEKVVIANLLRNFKIKSLDHRDVTLTLPDVILRNAEPVRLQLTLR